MVDAQTSQQNFRAIAWMGSSTEEEARTYLQQRLELLSKLMFWSFAALIAFIKLMYWRYPTIEPRHNAWIIGISVGGLIVLAVIWRLGLARKELDLRRLRTIDTFYAVSTGMAFGAAGYLSSDLQVAPLSCLLYLSFMVLLRAIVVPSTGSRTAIVGSVTFLPIVIAAVMIALLEQQPLPGPAYVAGALLLGTVVVMLATVGSRIIYGLREKFSAAMQLGQYTLMHKIGEGGMGVVYRAKHALLRRATAIKLVHPSKVDADMLTRFEREVQAMSLLTHPNTVAVYDYGRSPAGYFYYAMEYLEGINLESLVTRYGPQPFDRVVAVLAQVAGALAEAHRAELIHRDIKPANIILCERGGLPDFVKVLDFGLVKEITGNTSSSSSTTKSILGTPAYVAPEAVTDPDLVGTPVDLYALGAVGYFLLTGRKVFDGKTPLDTCIQHVTGTPVPPSEARGDPLPPALEQLILELLAKAPDKRPTALELGKRLRAMSVVGDWLEAESAVWWADQRKKAHQIDTSSPTMTLNIDLGRVSPVLRGD